MVCKLVHQMFMTCLFYSTANFSSPTYKGGTRGGFVEVTSCFFYYHKDNLRTLCVQKTQIFTFEFY